MSEGLGYTQRDIPELQAGSSDSWGRKFVKAVDDEELIIFTGESLAEGMKKIDKAAKFLVEKVRRAN